MTNKPNEITLKIPYQSDSLENIKNFIINYNSVLKFTYNRLVENDKLSTKELTALQKRMSNVFINSHLKNSAIFDSKALIKRLGDKKCIFGGKKLFLDRCKDKISREEFQAKRLVPLLSIGEANHKGNRLFQIINENEILFKPSAKEHFTLNIKVNKKWAGYLKALSLKQENKEIPITYHLDMSYVYITFDLNQIEKFKTTHKIKNRVFAVDLNPNYVGWTIVDWKSEKEYDIVKSGVFSLKDLNDYDDTLKGASTDTKKKYVTNKRRHEVIQIGYKLCKLANYYRCELFGIEDLNIRSSDKGRGKRFNKLCNNQWCRNTLVHIVTKLTSLYQIECVKVMANYSSFLGNLVYRRERLPDMCLSSIEIGRRAYEFYHQYVRKDKNKEKNIIFDKLENVADRIAQSLEELHYSETFDSLLDLYNKLKKARLKYRLSFDESRKFFRKNHKNSFQTSFVFI